MDNFDSSSVEAAWTYHRQIGGSHAKGNVPVEVAAFLAGACWAKQVFAEHDEELRAEGGYRETFAQQQDRERNQ
jgi:hypothetical protein